MMKPTRKATAPDFEDLAAAFCDVPRTWLPSLLMHLVTACLAQDVFQAGGLIRSRFPQAVRRAPRPSHHRASGGATMAIRRHSVWVVVLSVALPTT